MGVPFARCAAAGAKMSRPWKVFDIGESTMPGDAISYAASGPPSTAHAIDSSPLSGPDQHGARS